ncbi:GNAT family protein [Streptomyces sp. SID13031]|uniref:GNAT family N-acetyltransferase n=1 Tax=Streptomyces sp. SID13031 TaxID=2706046 RepID=UPI0013CB389F|nr:GNAT family protein [Streptomyces sp. SID13031]NEA37329.1 GNAT family N-acetyltransferase [Streptomyces sp. SID13031]
MITTERLEIRRFRPEDAEAFAAYRSIPEVARYQSWDVPVTLDSARTSVARFAAGDPLQAGWFQYAIALDGLLIGDVALNTFDNLMQADLGFTLAPAYQGKGYATEAVGALLEHVFTERDLHRVSAECDARNTSSAQLLERLGFQQEGFRPLNTWFKNEWTDDLLFGLLQSNWRSARTAS